MALSFFWVYDAQPCLSCEHHQVKVQASDMFSMHGRHGGTHSLGVFFSGTEGVLCVILCDLLPAHIVNPQAHNAIS